MKKFILLTSLLLLMIVSNGHEYILLAYKYVLQKGDDLEMHLFVSDGFNIQLERPHQKGMTTKFELMTKNGTTDLSLTEDGKFPIINRKVDFDGGGLIHIDRGYSRISILTAKFLEYLKEDHIEKISNKVDSKKKVQKERYTRYIKSLVQSGDDLSDTLYRTVVGQNFEIILLDNPYKMKTGDVIKAEILFLNKPLTNKIITARNRSGSEASTEYTCKTNSKGICTFKINRKGEWFIHATHMIPCVDKNDSDWESFWTSYSFGIKK